MQLGELEKQVLQYLWNTQEADAKQVHAVLGLTRGNTLNTIQSTLDRLFKKQLLSRTKQGHAYYYRAKVDRDALLATLISSVTSDFVTEGVAVTRRANTQPSLTSPGQSTARRTCTAGQ